LDFLTFEDGTDSQNVDKQLQLRNVLEDLIWSNILSLDFFHRLFNEVLRFGSRLCFRLQVKETQI